MTPLLAFLAVMTLLLLAFAALELAARGYERLTEWLTRRRMHSHIKASPAQNCGRFADDWRASTPSLVRRQAE